MKNNNVNRGNKKTDAERRNAQKNTVLLYAVVAAMILMAPALPAYASFLPSELGEWRLISEHATYLTASDDLGKWTNASYVRPAPPAAIEVQLMEGSGVWRFYVPEGVVSSDDGPIGLSSTYETLAVSGKRAVLERSDLLGQALAVALGRTHTVTFEARGVSREELLGFAESMIEALPDGR